MIYEGSNGPAISRIQSDGIWKPYSNLPEKKTLIDVLKQYISCHVISAPEPGKPFDKVVAQKTVYLPSGASVARKLRALDWESS